MSVCPYVELTFLLNLWMNNQNMIFVVKKVMHLISSIVKPYQTIFLNKKKFIFLNRKFQDFIISRKTKEKNGHFPAPVILMPSCVADNKGSIVVSVRNGHIWKSGNFGKGQLTGWKLSEQVAI